jgi:hypothetical protein
MRLPLARIGLRTDMTPLQLQCLGKTEPDARFTIEGPTSVALANNFAGLDLVGYEGSNYYQCPQELGAAGIYDSFICTMPITFSQGVEIEFELNISILNDHFNLVTTWTQSGAGAE